MQRGSGCLQLARMPAPPSGHECESGSASNSGSQGGGGGTLVGRQKVHPQEEPHLHQAGY